MENLFIFVLVCFIVYLVLNFRFYCKKANRTNKVIQKAISFQPEIGRRGGFPSPFNSNSGKITLREFHSLFFLSTGKNLDRLNKMGSFTPRKKSFLDKNKNPGRRQGDLEIA